MPMYQGYNNDEQKIKVLVYTFLVLLLIGYGINFKRKKLRDEQGEILKNECGRTVESFSVEFGEPLYDAEQLYKEGKKSRRYRRFQSKLIQDCDTVYYAIWLEGDRVYQGACFLPDSTGEYRAKSVLRLNYKQLYGR